MTSRPHDVVIAAGCAAGEEGGGHVICTACDRARRPADLYQPLDKPPPPPMSFPPPRSAKPMAEKRKYVKAAPLRHQYLRAQTRRQGEKGER